MNDEVSYCTDGLGSAYCTYSPLGVSPLFCGGHARYRMGKGHQLLGLNSSFLGSSGAWVWYSSILKSKGVSYDLGDIGSMFDIGAYVRCGGGRLPGRWLYIYLVGRSQAGQGQEGVGTDYYPRCLLVSWLFVNEI